LGPIHFSFFPPLFELCPKLLFGSKLHFSIYLQENLLSTPIITLHPYKPPNTQILSFLPFYFLTIFSPFSEQIEFTSQPMFPNVIFHFDKFTETLFKNSLIFEYEN
jgi:hypothetical protein